MNETTTAPVLVDGRWRLGDGETFAAIDPATRRPIGTFPTSSWDEIDEALDAGSRAYPVLRDTDPERIAVFLRSYADAIEARSDEIVAMAAQETALPSHPRLAEIELPRTTDQLRQAADAAVSRSWVNPVLSPSARIASMLGPLPGVVFVFGPNNFPLAFNGISGGDFAAAIATRHPVIAKANPGHPGTTRLLGELALQAVAHAELPEATVQLLYKMSHDDGERMVADPRVAATGYTGSRRAGLALKAAADQAGVPIYLEMSSVNPVVVLPGAAAERTDEIATGLVDSLLLGCGQFCTKPGVMFVVGDAGRSLVDRMAEVIAGRPNGTLLGEGVEAGLQHAKEHWRDSGASVVVEGEISAPGWSFPNTLMSVEASAFAADPEALQEEAFGNMGLVVLAESVDQLVDVLPSLEGGLTGTIWMSEDGTDDDAYGAVEPLLRDKVGRLLNDKAPTGVAVVPPMNHGGPYPSTGHAGFTAVGIPASLVRFGMLQSYDNVADRRLPPELQAANPLGIQRFVEGEWTREPVEWG